MISVCLCRSCTSKNFYGFQQHRVFAGLRPSIFSAKGVNKFVKIGASEVGRVDRVVERVYQDKNDFNEVSFRAPVCARIATYESPSSCPQIEEILAENPVELVGLLATKTYQTSQDAGGRIPFSAIKEVVENLIHANFRDSVVSVFQGGNTIKVSDHGPGIVDKTGALEPGHSTATPETRGLIKGVGSGLSVALEAMKEAGGTLRLEDNLNEGSVVTLNVSHEPAEPARPQERKEPAVPRLSKRQKKAVFIILEMAQVGPSRLATELSVGLSTAYRELRALEGLGLIACDKQGKRYLTPVGTDSLDAIMNNS